MTQQRSKTAYFTICARNYMAYALTLKQSLQSHKPEIDFYIFLADRRQENDMLTDNNVIPVDTLGHPAFKDMCFKYTLLELSTAVKPWCFEHILRSLNYQHAVYLDPDIQVFSDLKEIELAFDSDAEAVFTPHLLKPLTDHYTPSDLDILRSGTLNLGFAGFSRSKASFQFLEWWATQLQEYCYVDLQNGLFVDQKFADFAPYFIEHTKIIRHPGYNLAYWNLANRTLQNEHGRWTVNGEELGFFHFSGVKPGDSSTFSKHQNRITMENCGPAAQLHAQYLTNLRANNHGYWSKAPYAYGFFDSGEAIPDAMRRGPPADPEHPFARPNLAYWSAPSERVEADPDWPTITRIMHAIHDRRPDLQRTFPLSTKSGRASYHAWLIDNFDHLTAGLTVQSTPDKSRPPRWLTRIWLSIGRRLSLY